MEIKNYKENETETVYSITADETINIGDIEQNEEVKAVISGSKYNIEGDMDDPKLFWLTVSK